MKRFVLLAVLGAMPLASFAQFTTSFETPEGYTYGDAAGQNGWTLSSGTGSVFQITNNRAHVGTNSVFSTATSGGLYDLRHTIGSGTGIYNMSGWMFVDSATFGANRAFGMALTNGTSSGSTVAGITVDGTGAIRFATSYSSMYGGSGTPVATGRTNDVTDRWLNLNVSFNTALTTNNVTWTLSGLGTASGLPTITTTGTVANPATAINSFVLFNEWTSATTSSAGTAYWDDINVTSPVPEPATMAVLGLGALGLIRRKRQAKK